MSDATTFYILGSVLAAMAVITSLIGLRVESFPGRFGPVVFLCFLLVVGGATTYAVLNGQHEEEVRAAENEEAGKAFEEEEEQPAPAESGEEASGEAAKPEGPGGTLKLAASPTALAFSAKTLASKPGKVTIDFTNPSAIGHDVAIEQDGDEIAVSEEIVEGKTSVSADLAPGNYTFICTVPGHAQAGMEGTLTVK